MGYNFTWIYLIIAVVVFLICRELICWYWKLNDIVSLLRDIKKSLDDIKSCSDSARNKIIDEV